MKFAVAIATLLAVSAPARGQYLTRPQIPWRTISTARFDIHYPAEMEEWTRAVARQIESIGTDVNGVVGNTPTSRVTILVEDPSNVANGFALPFMEGPVIFLWPTPPSPSPTFGTHRGWGEALAVHEYGHIAHLTFPSRNSRERLLWKFLPVRISPVARKAPAWVIEGYATLIEGQLTGSGRPFSAGRAAVLRQWALEGRLPTYGQLNGTGAFLGGNMRYLAGSAFLEWLQQRRGDSSLVHLWRRMSARVDRSFDAAFAGVFGAGPGDLYAAFTVDLTEHALQIRSRLRDAGVVEGELVQRLTGGTGEPAVSPDGGRVALVLRSLGGPSRLVVLSTQPEPDSAVRRVRERLLRLDSLDVAPFDSFPLPRRVLASLRPFHGRSHEQPRWMPDGVTLLVTRDEPAPNGITRPDLFAWNTRTREVRRITKGASIRQADPAPNGRDAVAVRCAAGICSVVIIDLATGRWRDIAKGTPNLVWYRPRYSPDGANVAVSFQEGGFWGVALIDVASGSVKRLASDAGVSRHSPAFTPSGRELVVVSERGGIPNLELVPLDSTTPPRSLTRVTGAALSPDVSRRDGSTWFLTLRAGGYDLRRVSSPLADAGPIVSVHGALSPAAPPTSTVAAQPTLGDASSLREHGYGLGPRQWRVLPGGFAGPDGSAATMMVNNIDPIGRLSVVTQGSFGTQGTWRGASLTAGLRRVAVALDASGWYIEHEPSKGRDRLAFVPSDLRLTGGGVQARLTGEGSNTAYLGRLLASLSAVRNDSVVTGNRAAIAAEGRYRLSATAGPLSLSTAVGLFGEAGKTLGENWQRSISSAAIGVFTARYGVRAEWLLGRASGRTFAGGRPPVANPGRALEQFILGGARNPLIEPGFLSNRITLPAVPSGYLSGPTVQLVRTTFVGNPWEPYFVWANRGHGLDDIQKIAGIERTFSIGSMGFVRLPGIRAQAGASYSFDDPYRNRARAYLSLIYSP